MRVADRHLHADAESDAWDDAHQCGNDDDIDDDIVDRLHASIIAINALIDAHAERCKAETRAIVQEALDRISIKVGFWIRSDAQKRRWERAQKAADK